MNLSCERSESHWSQAHQLGRWRGDWRLVAVLFSSLVYSGCVEYVPRYLEVHIAIPQLAHSECQAVWYLSATRTGKPGVVGNWSGTGVPNDKVVGLLREASSGKSGWWDDFLRTNPTLVANSARSSWARTGCDELGVGTVCFVRELASYAWEQEASTGKVIASANGLLIKGANGDWLCRVSEGGQSGTVWSRAKGSAGEWTECGRVVRTSSSDAGDTWVVNAK